MRKLVLRDKDGYLTEIDQKAFRREALALKDKEMLEDLIAAATAQAIEKAKKLLADEARKSAAEVGLPPMFAIPEL